jgi:predicted RNA binding protein YcfA (HicA-like mRNA interferase family)
MTRTIRKRKIRKCLTTKRRIGGGVGDDETIDAVISYVQNVAVQILNNIEEPRLDNHRTSNTRFYKMGKDKEKLFRYLCASLGNNFEIFKKLGGDLINKRNETIHPKNLVDVAKKCLTLCIRYSLTTTLKFELSIINYFLHPKVVTRSMTRTVDQNGYELVTKKGVAATKTNYDTGTDTVDQNGYELVTKKGVAATKTNYDTGTDTVEPKKLIPTKNIDSSWERGKSTTYRKT